ncbi:MAG: hypothetical protein ACOCQE_03315 [Halanaerobium sp.]
MRKLHRINIYKILFVITLIILIIYGGSLKNSYLEMLELEIKKTNIRNSLSYYRNLYKAEEDNDTGDPGSIDLEQKAEELIEKSGSRGLELVHYSSTREEIILNLKGDFEPLFYFLNWVEENENYLEIENLKIKKEGLSLFCYLRLLKSTFSP